MTAHALEPSLWGVESTYIFISMQDLYIEKVIYHGASIVCQYCNKYIVGNEIL